MLEVELRGSQFQVCIRSGTERPQLLVSQDQKQKENNGRWVCVCECTEMLTHPMHLECGREEPA